jgi:hypothetical protein
LKDQAVVTGTKQTKQAPKTKLAGQTANLACMPYQPACFVLCLLLAHRHLKIIDYFKACLVCFISTVNSRIRKRRKEAYFELR